MNSSFSLEEVDFINWILNLHDSEFLAQMITNGGIAVVVLIVFVETGLLAGFFLPGDSLLITAGVLTSSSAIGGRPLIELWPLLILTSISAVVGDQLGFYLGTKGGLLVEKNTRPKLKRFLDEATDFFREFGPSAIIIARFIPIMRTFVPFAAGLSHMPYVKFVKLNIGGGILWVFSMVFVGHYLGKTPLANEIHKIIVIVILVSALPVVYSVIKRYGPRLLKRKP